MRVGTAGVLLRATSAVKVAADFAALELFYPGRIDLGIAGGLAGRPYDEALTVDVRLADDVAFADRVRRLVEMVRGDDSPGTKGAVPQVGPVTDTRPQLWMCGTSRRSAQIAARFGMRLAFHQYLAPSMRADEIAHAYRDAFLAAVPGDAPYFAIAGYGACAADEAAARAEWDSAEHEARLVCFLGSPQTCAQQLADLAGSGGADEIVVDCVASTFEARLAGLRGLAEAWISRSQC